MPRGKSDGHDKAAAVLVALDGVGQPEGCDLDQLRHDAAVGRALREAATADRDEASLFHVSWVTEDGRTTGKFLGDPRLYYERAALAEAADALIERLSERTDA